MLLELTGEVQRVFEAQQVGSLSNGLASVQQSGGFLRYKQGTLHMVKSLKLPTMQPLDPEAMKLIYKKQR